MERLFECRCSVTFGGIDILDTGHLVPEEFLQTEWQPLAQRVNVVGAAVAKFRERGNRTLSLKWSSQRDCGDSNAAALTLASMLTTLPTTHADAVVNLGGGTFTIPNAVLAQCVMTLKGRFVLFQFSISGSALE